MTTGNRYKSVDAADDPLDSSLQAWQHETSLFALRSIGDSRVRADLRTGPGASSLNFSKSRTTGIKLSERVPVYLVAETAPEATATMIRVVLKSIRYDGKAPTSAIDDL